MALILGCTSLCALGQPTPSIEWQRAYGGSWQDIGWSIHQTEDGGYLAVGYSSSSDGDANQNGGETNYWVLRIDGSGNLLWVRSLGGASEDYGFCGVELANGTFLIGGQATSTGGDVTDSHGGGEAWLVNLDPEGDLIWQRAMGGGSDDRWTSMKNTPEGGAITIGWTYSTDGDVPYNHGGWDIWVARLNNTDSVSWTRTYGGSDLDYGEDIVPTDDGGSIFTGYATSVDGDLSGNAGNGEGWVVKLNGSGDIEWQRDYGGANMDWLRAIAEVPGGGYIAVGQSNSDDGDLSGNHGGTDAWVVRVNGDGEPLWQRALGGSGEDFATSVISDDDGGFLVCGRTDSNDGDVVGNHGGFDAWVVHLDANGDMVWQLPLGGSGFDLGNRILRTADGGFVMLGQTASPNAGVPGYHGSRDYWVIKFAPPNTTLPSFDPSALSIWIGQGQQLHFTLPSPGKPVEASVWDSAGRLVGSKIIRDDDPIMNLSGLAPGAYVVQLHSSHVIMHHRFVLQP